VTYGFTRSRAGRHLVDVTSKRLLTAVFACAEEDRVAVRSRHTRYGYPSARHSEDAVSKSDFDPESCYVFTKAGQLPLVPREPDDYIVWYQSELRALDSDDLEAEPKRLVGKAEWAIVKCSSAANDDEPLLDVFDAESQDMLAVYEVIIDPADGSFRPFEGWGDLLYFQGIDVEPEFDARDVCREFIDHVLRFSGSCCGAVFIFGVHDHPELRAAFVDRGFEKFQQVADMEFYILDLALKTPPLPPLARDRANVRELRARGGKKP